MQLFHFWVHLYWAGSSEFTNRRGVTVIFGSTGRWIPTQLFPADNWNTAVSLPPCILKAYTQVRGGKYAIGMSGSCYSDHCIRYPKTSYHYIRWSKNISPSDWSESWCHITTRGSILVETLTVVKLTKKFRAFYGTRKLISVVKTPPLVPVCSYLSQIHTLTRFL